jgi:hypothetical protein
MQVLHFGNHPHTRQEFHFMNPLHRTGQCSRASHWYSSRFQNIISHATSWRTHHTGMPQLWGLEITFCPRSTGCSALMPGHYPTLSTLTSDTTTECWLKTSSRRAQFLQEHMKGNNGHWQCQNQPNTLESFRSEWNIVTKQMHANTSTFGKFAE